MALTGTNRGTGTHNTGSTSFGLSPGSNFAASTMAVLCVAADNSASGGSSNNITDVTDSLGNTWIRRQLPIFDNGAASAGVQGVIATCMQERGLLTTGTTITVSFGATTTAKTWTLTQVAAGTGLVPVYKTGGAQGTGQSGTTAPTYTTGSITNTNLIVAAIFMESGTTQAINTDDSDGSNGAWGNSSVSQYAEVGSTTAGSCIASNFKTVTATATQTYNLTLAATADTIAAYVEIQEELMPQKITFSKQSVKRANYY
jgi:hypothetical protein